MAITDAAFDSENELQTWAFANHETFFGKSILLPGFKIVTTAGKGGVPDGFAFRFDEGQLSWWVIECELLKHGVWPHIAEQITRFVVATRNPATLRQVRDKLFEKLLTDHLESSVAKSLGTDTTRLLQQLELYLEAVSPSLAILIDDTDPDLLEFCDALDIPSEIYRISKFVVNGQCEYYSPDKNQPAATFDSSADKQEGSTAFDVIAKLGGGEVVSGKNRCYRLQDGRIVKIQFSKYHERHNYYWYGISPTSYEQSKTLGASQFIFVMDDDGFVSLPVSTVDKYLQTAYVSRHPDQTVKHYHMYISAPPEVKLTGSTTAPDIDVSGEFQTFT